MLASDPGDSPNEKTFGQAQYVNQWRFRTIYNKTFNCEYFYNAGSLNGEEILRQFLHVVRCLEFFVGAMIFGVVMDAGGSNARFMSLACKGEKEDICGYRLTEKVVSLPNPCLPKHQLALCTCTTHSHCWQKPL